MTTHLDCIKALAARPDQLPQPLAFIAHPAWAEDESMLVVLRGMQANGMDVRVQADIRLPPMPAPAPASRALGAAVTGLAIFSPVLLMMAWVVLTA